MKVSQHLDTNYIIEAQARKQQGAGTKTTHRGVEEMPTQQLPLLIKKVSSQKYILENPF